LIILNRALLGHHFAENFAKNKNVRRGHSKGQIVVPKFEEFLGILIVVVSTPVVFNSWGRVT